MGHVPQVTLGWLSGANGLEACRPTLRSTGWAGMRLHFAGSQRGPPVS
jgi:hypothetical protein